MLINAVSTFLSSLKLGELSAFNFKRAPANCLETLSGKSSLKVLLEAAYEQLEHTIIE